VIRVQKETIAEVEERLRQAMLHSDVGVLDELLAPELVFTNQLGQVTGKQDDLSFHRSSVLKLKELVPSEQCIQLYDAFATVSVLMHLIGFFEDAPLDVTIRYTRVWEIFPSGSVRLVAGHASAVPQ